MSRQIEISERISPDYEDLIEFRVECEDSYTSFWSMFGEKSGLNATYRSEAGIRAMTAEHTSRCAACRDYEIPRGLKVSFPKVRLH